MWLKTHSTQKAMFPFVVAAMVVATPTCVLASTIRVAFLGDTGFVPNPSVTGGVLDKNIGILNPAVNPSQLVLAQLIFSTDPINDALSSDSVSGFVSGDDKVLVEFTVGETGDRVPHSEFADYSLGVGYEAPFQPGYIFGRIFSNLPTDAPSLFGNFYYDGPVVPVKELHPFLPPPQVYSINRNTLPGGIGDYLNLAATPPVPYEPSTLAATPVPSESSTLVLLMVGMSGLACRKWKVR